MELSLVMSIGCDDYGNKIYRDVEPAVPTPEKKRTEYCLFTLREAFKHIDYELIIVEWLGNETGERPSEWKFIKDERTRIITVPYAFTSKICPERPFHETHAKNIGIRRARGDMILSINNDCLWLDEFPKECLKCDGVMIANRPTVYHTVLEYDLDIQALRNYCSKAENVVHVEDWNSNGDFTLMHKGLWFKLQGLSTPRGDVLAGVDIQTIVRAEQLTGKRRYIYPYNVVHQRHPGAPLSSGYNIIDISPDWGFPNEEFKVASFI
jgi:hypothetical protein